MPRQTIESIVYGDWIVTMDAARPIIADGAVAIDQGKIVGVGSANDIRKKFLTTTEFPGADRVVLPGLINGHTHAAMTLLRGYSDDVPLVEWLNDHIYPVESKSVSEEYCRIGTELACWEMIRGGTTTFVDMYFFHEVVASVVDEIGIRALISATVVDRPRNDARDVDEQWLLASSFCNEWPKKNPGSTAKPILGGHAIYTLAREHLIELCRRSKEYQRPINIHIAETQFENDYSLSNFGATPIQFLESIDFFSVPVIAAHVVWSTEDEVDILAKRNVGVVHNPSSNTKIASGIAPIAKYLDAGITVGLGTDGAATNNDLDMWEEMRLAAFLQKVTTMDPTVLPARVVLEMATTKGADAIGMGGEIGSIREGMQADLLQVGIHNAHHLPVYDIESHLVYATHASDVRTVLVQGRGLYVDGMCVTIDTGRLRQDITKIAGSIRQFRREADN